MGDDVLAMIFPVRLVALLQWSYVGSQGYDERGSTCPTPSPRPRGERS